ncbi:hypothetical_protein [Candidozyma auris]|uniref:hypothetical_protein n=1 Tax=Candidozyma auris TaxID=498019 RepID=UPI000D26896E|nr:hypothetical_protein [[Candida] auris]QEO21121.1 hypothetical_protein [[Candida] auris]GBL48367.1 hypothetical protein CAJCM15448_06410 [[Candida] auris]
MGFLRGMKHSFGQPFRNLSIQQRLLQLFRFASSILTVAFAIAYLIQFSNIDRGHLARINCAHLDVALGLYKSLRTSISSTDVIGEGSDILPVHTELTDSEIHILTQYTEKQVADAAQYILLGADQFCMITFESTHSATNHVVEKNVETNCRNYGPGGLFDYPEIMSEAGLDIILAYAYESSYQIDDEYGRRFQARNKRFHVIKAVMIFEALAQSVILMYGFVLYNNRGGAKDLSSIPNITLNGLALLALGAGVTMIVASSIATNELRSMQKEISKGMSSYGVEMVIGDTFLALVWCTFAFAVLTMLSWALPLWCSNPNDDGYNSDDETTYQYRDYSGNGDGDTFVVQPYQVSRQLKRNKTKQSISRLFDETAALADDDKNVTSTGTRGYRDEGPFASPEDADTAQQHNPFQPEMVESSSHIHNETELRRLGDTIQRKFSGRRKNSKHRRQPSRDWLPERSATHDLLYGDNHFSNHQYPHSLPGISENDNLSRASTLKKLATTNRSRSDTVNGLQSQAHQNLHIPMSQHGHNGSGDNISVLDEQELQLLDNAQFINKIV